jgi:hypothetical protein
MRPFFPFAACVILAGVSTTALSQGFSALTLSGGYAFAVVEESDANAAGWRANVLFEQGRMGSASMHGAAVGFAMAKASVTTQATASDSTIATLPLYYTPKYTPVEYEGAYVSNSFYRHGFLHSITAGAGMEL